MGMGCFSEAGGNDDTGYADEPSVATMLHH
jgi:hypothetical protein